MSPSNIKLHSGHIMLVVVVEGAVEVVLLFVDGGFDIPPFDALTDSNILDAVAICVPLA